MRRPVSGSTRVRRPTGGSSSSRGSSTSTASTSWRPRTDRSSRSQPAGSRKSEITTTRPRRRASGPMARRALIGRPCGRWPRAVGALGVDARGVVASRWSSAMTASRPERGGTVTRPPGRRGAAPSRLPARAVRKPTAAVAASARSRFSHAAVPKSRLGDWSTTTQVSSSRSAIVSRTWATVVRAVRFQSMRRTSSPGWYSRPSPGSLPEPGTRPWWSPCRRPSRRRVMVSSRWRRAAPRASPGRELTQSPRCGPGWGRRAAPRRSR